MNFGVSPGSPKAFCWCILSSSFALQVIWNSHGSFSKAKKTPMVNSSNLLHYKCHKIPHSYSHIIWESYAFYFNLKSSDTYFLNFHTSVIAFIIWFWVFSSLEDKIICGLLGPSSKHSDTSSRRENDCTNIYHWHQHKYYRNTDFLAYFQVMSAFKRTWSHFSIWICSLKRLGKICSIPYEH